MPRPLHATAIRNRSKTQNTFATHVGADLCVGPLHTSRLRARAHTQVRPYKVGMGSLINHASEPRHPPWRGGLNCKARHRRVIPRSGSAAGTAPARSRKRAGRPSADRRSDYARTNTGTPRPRSGSVAATGRLREAVRQRALPARGAGAQPLPITKASRGPASR